MPKYTSDEKLKKIAEENALYLRHLRRDANASLAAQFAKRSRKTFASRRRADPVFDAECAAAIAFGAAAVASRGGRARAGGNGLLTTGGEYMVAPNQAGVMQVRRAKAGFVTRRGEEAFLVALAQTANIQLAAQSVGVRASVFYKRRARSPDFAARMQEALAAGYEAVEFALVGTALRTLAPDGEVDGTAGVDEGLAPIEPPLRMTVDQAMALIAQRAKTMAIGDRHARGSFTKMPTAEETDALIRQRLDMLRRLQAKKPGFLAG